MPYTSDKARVDPLMAQVRSILSRLPLSYFAEVRDAPIEQDLKNATDLTLRITGGDIAARLRFPPCRFRDLTLRAHRDSGAKTELAKIREGFAYRYFYGWIDDANIISSWILVDLDHLRSSGLLEKERPLIPNRTKYGKPDGTYFIGIDTKEISEAGCLIVSAPQRQINTQPSLLEGIERAKERNYVNPSMPPKGGS